LKDLIAKTYFEFIILFYDSERHETLKNTVHECTKMHHMDTRKACLFYHPPSMKNGRQDWIFQSHQVPLPSIPILALTGKTL